MTAPKTEQEVKALLERARQYLALGQSRESDDCYYTGDAIINDLLLLCESLRSSQGRWVPEKMPQEFLDWVCHEIPPRTIISNPSWWAPKLYRAALAAAPQSVSSKPQLDPFNCPQCGAHDFGLHCPKCPHCGYNLPEWIVVEDSRKNTVFAPDEAAFPKGLIPRNVAERVLGRSMEGTQWFTREESALLRAQPEWKSEPNLTELADLIASPQNVQQSVSGRNEATEEMADSVRGILQIIRNKPGATFQDVRKNCAMRGDEINNWPAWILDAEGYVTEQDAATMIFEIMRDVGLQTPEPPKREGTL